ncbi:MAG: hypothetical protein AAFQ74_09130 [Cyanobacteria bacterium J06623_4]
MGNSHLQGLALPRLELPDSLDQLANIASQLQTAISAALSHPILAVLSVLLTIALIQIIADLVKRLIKASLAFVLKLPLLLSQWLWQRVTASDESPDSTKVEDLLTRLEILRQEQDQILAELKQLLSDSSKPHVPSLNPPAEPTSESQTAKTESRSIQQASEAAMTD